MNSGNSDLVVQRFRLDGTVIAPEALVQMATAPERDQPLPVNLDGSARA